MQLNVQTQLFVRRCCLCRTCAHQAGVSKEHRQPNTVAAWRGWGQVGYFTQFISVTKTHRKISRGLWEAQHAAIQAATAQHSTTQHSAARECSAFFPVSSVSQTTEDVKVRGGYRPLAGCNAAASPDGAASCVCPRSKLRLVIGHYQKPTSPAAGAALRQSRQ